MEANELGQRVAAETGFLIEQNPDTVRTPDIGFVRQERVQAVGMTRRYWPGATHLAVEVVSPSGTVNEVEEWLSAGTRLVWVVNPRQRTVTVHRPATNPVILAADDRLQGADVLPGFEGLVREVFP